MRRRRDGSRSVMSEMGFGVDIGERIRGRPGSQVDFLIGCVEADGRFRLRWSLQT